MLFLIKLQLQTYLCYYKVMGTCNEKISISSDPLFSLCQPELTTQNSNVVKLKETQIYSNSQQIIYYISDKWKQSSQQVSGTGMIYKSQSFLYYGNVLNDFPKARGKLYWLNNQYCDFSIYKHAKKSEKKPQKQLQVGKFEGVWSQKMVQSGKYYPNIKETQKYMLLHSLSLSNQSSNLQNPQSNNKIMIQLQLTDKSFYKGYMTLNKEKGIYEITGYGQLIYPHHSNQNNPPHSYIGQWKQNKMHGQGTFTWKNGEKYIGSYQAGLKHGDGRFYFSDNHFIQAKWVLGKKEGVGAQIKDGTKRYTSFIADVEKN